MAQLVKCDIDTSNLMKAQALFQRHSKRDPAESLNKTVLFIARDAQRRTPFVTIGRIDAQLNVQTTRRISTRTGKPVSPKTKNANLVNVTEGGAATKITLARLHMFSRYNKMTDFRYWLPLESFSPGQGQSGFWKKIDMVATRMVKARHSSTHFFQASWGAIIRLLAAHVPGASTKAIRSASNELGSVLPAKTGTTTPTVVIENLIGNAKRYPTINMRRNLAAQRILVPVLRSAIEAEFWSKLYEAEKRGWIRDKAAFKAFGIVIDV